MSVTRPSDPSTGQRLFVDPGFDGEPSSDGVPAVGGYRSFTPRPSLRAFVERITVGAEAMGIEEIVVPDGGVHLVFHIGTRPMLGDGTTSPAAAVIGAASTAARIRFSGTLAGVSVRLRPGGVLAALGVPAGRLFGRATALEDVWGARAEETLQRLAGTSDPAARAAIVEDALSEFVTRRGLAPDPRAARAARMIAATAGRGKIADIAAAVGVGERRLEQLFDHHVGIAPKVLARIARFQASVRLLADRPAPDWSRIAHACGFADQSHLIGEYRRIAGMTPTEFLRRFRISDSYKTRGAADAILADASAGSGYGGGRAD